MAKYLSFLLLVLILCSAKAAEDSATKEATTKDETTDGSIGSQQQQCSEDDETCKIRIVTVEELSTKNGEDGGKELWLSILGKVYDVSKGPEYYAPGSGYHIFAGRDGTVPFITGNFTDAECAKHTDELTASQLYALDKEWGKFYATEEKYPFVGFLCCRFYDEQGQPTEEIQRVWERVAGYEIIKAAKDKERKLKREKRKQMGMMAGAMKEATSTTAA